MPPCTITVCFRAVHMVRAIDQLEEMAVQVDRVRHHGLIHQLDAHPPSSPNRIGSTATAVNFSVTPYAVPCCR